MNKQNKRWLIVGAQGITLSALVIGTVAFVGANKTVALTVDGQTRSVQTFGGNVQDVLRAGGVSVDGDDLVYPALDSSVSNGSAVDVRLAREVNVTVDGTQRSITTTAQTVDELADQIGVEAGSKLSLAGSIDLASASTDLAVITPKTLTVDVAGKEKSLTTTALDVRAALTELGVKPDKDDKVSPALNTVVKDGLAVAFTEVSSKKVTKKSDVEFETEEVKDKTLEEGKKKTKTEGKVGQREQVYAVVLENGKEVSRKKTSDKVVTKPTAEVISVGTKKPEPKPEAASESAPGTSSSGPSAGVWAQLAKCESGGNWGINSGNGYYGGLQFTAQTWRAMGGTSYAPLPHQASASEQIAVATKLQKRAGWGQWPACTSKLGLR